MKVIYLKDESNRFGLPSFKILGAAWGCYHAITSKLSIPATISLSDLRSRLDGSNLTLYAATDGNHGRAVAFMATLLSIKAMIFVPQTLDRYTQDAIESSGGTVIAIKGDYDQVVKEAERQSKLENGILVQDTSWPGYEDIPARIVQGYSTIFLELAEQIPVALKCQDVVIVPVGVGSLAHATVLNLKNKPVGPRVVAIEPDTAACLNASLHAGELRSIDTSFTIMTGMNCGTVSYSGWEDLKREIDISLTISDSQAHQSVKYLHDLGINAGPCGAACLAAVKILTEQRLITEDSVVILISTEGWRPYELPMKEVIE